MQAGVQPDTAICNSIMRQQAAAGLGPGALQDTLADMEARGLTPDRRSLFVLLRAFSREGDLAGAMHVMHRMAQLGAPTAKGIEDVEGQSNRCVQGSTLDKRLSGAMHVMREQHISAG